MSKGLLIIMLIFHHIVYYGFTCFDINIDVLKFMSDIQIPLIVSYFMPAFFFITGICSNFEKDYKTFLISQVKSLLVPLFFCTIFNWAYYNRTLSGLFFEFYMWKDGNLFWFLFALFFSKNLYYILKKYIKNKITLCIFIVILSFLGSVLNDIDIIKNYLVHRHTLDLTLYLAIGNLFKDYIFSNKVFITSIAIYLMLAIVYLFLGINMPLVTNAFHSHYNTWIFHCILSITGSLIVINSFKRLKPEPLLEYLGKNTIVIYLSQGYILRWFFSIYKDYLLKCNLAESIFSILVIAISTLSFGLFLSYCINNSKLKFLLGKF